MSHELLLIMHVIFWGQRRINPVVDLQGEKHHLSSKPWTTEGFKQMIWQMWSSPSLLGYCFEVRISADPVIFHEQECLQGKEIVRVQSSSRISLQCCHGGNDVEVFAIAHALFCSHQTEEPSASSIWRLPHELFWSFWRTLSVQREFQGPSSSIPLHSLFYFYQLQ